MPPATPLRLAVCALGAWLLGGCVYAVRGGPETLVYSGGPVITQATVTGSFGFGSTSRDGHNTAITETITVGLGGDARNGGFTGSVLGGLEWFSVSENAPRRWGYRLNLDGGWRWRDPGAPVGEVVAQLRGGPVFRFVDRRTTGDPLLTLGVEATFGMAATLDDLTAANPVSVVGGLAITLSAMRIQPFHL